MALLVACQGYAAAEPGPKVVVVIASNVSIRDITADGLPNLTRMIRTGSLALMNTRTGRPSKDSEPVALPGVEAGCVSLGSGAMAVGGVEARRGADTSAILDGLPAAEQYSFRTGAQVGSAAVVHTEIIKLQKVNASSAYGAKPGALGEALKSAGVAAAVIGNSDIPEEPHREAVAVAMAYDGLVPYGQVEPEAITEPDPHSPYGIRTSVQGLAGELDRVTGKAGFVVIDFGDTYRADTYAQMCTDTGAALAKRKAIRRLDTLLGLVGRRLDPDRDYLLLVSPAPPRVTDIEQEKLTPIVISGPGFHGGTLTSGSTRRAGLVTISDFASTVLSFYGVQPPREIVGRTIKRVEMGQVVPRLLALNTRAAAQSTQMVGMRGGSVVQSGIVLLVTLALLVGVPGVWRSIARWAVVVIAALPLLMLCLPLLHIGSLPSAVAVLILLLAATITICRIVFRSPERAFVWLCAATFAGLVLDLVRGTPLMSASMAGYGFAEGARYYGIGNELMGTMLGAAIVGIGMALAGSQLGARLRGALAWLVCGTAFVAVGAPSLGANTGGAMAAFPGIAAILATRRGWKITLRGAVFVLIAMALMIAGLLAFDAMRGREAESHMGQAAGLVKGGHVMALVAIFQRKLALNFMLLSTSLWSRLLFLSLAGSAALYWWGKRTGGKWLSTEETAAATGCLVATAGAFAFNDSGVVAAACSAVFLWSMLALKVHRQTQRAC